MCHSNQREQKTPKTSPSLEACGPPFNTPILPAYSPPQTAFGSNQPFCHSTFSGQTDRQTDRHPNQHTRHETGDRSVRRALTLYYIDSERRANNETSFSAFLPRKNTRTVVRHYLVLAWLIVQHNSPFKFFRATPDRTCRRYDFVE